jgi:predicted amidophosphoribosyltransferase
MTGLTYRERRVNAEGSLRAALSVPDPARTKGKTIAVVDDVFTGGLTLREVARALRLQGGAAVVLGVTLTRQPAPPK